MVTIANVVGTGDLGVELDVAAVGRDLDVAFTEYDPSNYHGLYVRLVEDGPLITVFRSGKYIISGCSSFEKLHDTNRRFLQTLADLDIVDLSVETGFSVKNVVCTDELQDAVDLSTLSIGLGLESVEYEPEQFPGLIYRPSEFPAVVLVFANGKVVITGAPNIDMAEDTFAHLHREVNTLLAE